MEFASSTEVVEIQSVIYRRLNSNALMQWFRGAGVPQAFLRFRGEMKNRRQDAGATGDSQAKAVPWANSFQEARTLGLQRS